MVKNAREYPRVISIDLDIQNLYEYDGVLIDYKTQKIMGFKEGKSFPVLGKTSIQYHRARKKGGTKVLHKSTSPTDIAWFNINRQLLNFDHLIAIDTNTHYLNGSSVSITAAYHLIPHSDDSERVSCYTAVLALVEMWNIVGKPENVGWWQILQALENSSISLIGNIGLIVDSDLGSHEKFNSRIEPVMRDYFLPKNVQLIYGSDSGGKELLSTKMIKYCHDLASDLFIEENLLMNIRDLHPGVEGLYSHIRQWDVKGRVLRKFS